MATVDLVMPKMGESIMEATILKWYKQPGDPVKMDETVLEIATDKVDSEVPSTSSGVMEEILFNVNDVVPVGTVIAKIRTGATESSSTPKIHTPTPSSSTEHSYTPVQEIKSEFTPRTESRPSVNGNGNKFYSPLVLNIAASEGVSMSELEKIPGTGNEGRVTKKDILQYVAGRKSGSSYNSQARTTDHGPQTTERTTDDRPRTTPRFTSQPSEELGLRNYNVPTSYTGNVEIVELDRMRKLIAKHMVDSKHTSAHVTSFAEADVTHMVLWRDRVKKDFEKREGEKITCTPLFV